jgi:hypothetical protein
MKSPVAVRYFSLSPEGVLLRLSQVFVQTVHSHPEKVRVSSFAGRTMRLVSCVLRRGESGTIIGIRQMGFSLIRFDDQGRPDMDRYWKGVYAGFPSVLDKEHGRNQVEGNVLRMEKVFQGNGSKWKPASDEIELLEKAALGVIRPPEMGRGWRWMVNSKH